ncbi:AbrB/MazE/SpoVT family DNA-binding domain-containing protein [Lichenibacterium dinghuense]|uniref:AbrB/MazE/SpoVT family DNA-binding domain-containing protein n=1 Tax=Lichenibacterium dinghuense TaxID=2895977 RepID=UPI001F3AF9A3|nr:AbrB/MazE/SpoVT family DNA-binding domain-containing protein [Lichenibacterium sp. 6Y81]
MAAFTGRIDGGAVVVPDDSRKALGLDEGDAVRVELHGDELRIRSLRSVIRDVQEALKPYRIPGRLASDELIADRRAEVAREEAEEADRE